VETTQEFEVNLRNFKGDILQTIRGTPKQILEEVGKLPWPQNVMWADALADRMRDMEKALASGNIETACNGSQSQPAA
jgi:hypothetical protein